MSEKPTPRLTELELELLRIIWTAGSATVDEVIKALPPGRNTTYTTLQTRLNRLVEKGVLIRGHDGRLIRYASKKGESETQRSQIKVIIGRFLDGSAKAMVLSLLRGGDLSSTDLAELEKLAEKNRPPDDKSGK